MISINNVSKYYKDKAALKNVNLEFKKGEIYGLLGRNGAGKTTLINIMTNRIFASEGEVYIDGQIAKENDFAQSKIFCMTEKSGYPNEMKVQAGLRFAKDFYEGFDSGYADELCKLFEIDTKKQIKALSTGYNSIFKLILTLASGAEIMIFDEPVLGLDANFRELFYKELLKRFAVLENTVIISTHLIEEVSAILGEVAIIDEGKIIAAAPVEELKKIAYVVSGDKQKVESYVANKTLLHKEFMGNFMAATIKAELNPEESKSIKALGLDVSTPRLQEVFITLTGKENK